MKKSSLLTTAVAALALLGALAAPALAAVETIELKPGALDRGPDATVPHIEGTDLVDGDLTFAFPAADGVSYLGRSGDDYVVATWREQRTEHPRVVRVTVEDARTVVLSDVPVWELTLSQDGQQLIRPRLLVKQDTTRMKVWSALDGSLVATRELRGLVDVLDADEGRILLSSWTPRRTFWWDTTTDRTKKISDRAGYAASIRADRLAVVTKDPYRGGCSVVSTLTDPGTRLWRSCDQAVWEFSPTGTRMATVYLLADGLGPGAVEVHRAGGKLLARYSTYYFGDAVWETDESLLLLTHGTRKTAWVRCVVDNCQRASDLRPAPDPMP